MVRADGQAPPERAGAPDPLRGRCGPGLRGGERCATGPGRAPEAIREIRPDPPPGEDPVGAVPAASKGRPPGHPATGPPRDVRPAGVHPLLGPDAQGELGGEAEDGEGPPLPVTAIDRPVVRRAPPPPGCGAVGSPDGEAAWALCVLRDHRQYREPEQLPLPRDSALVQVALPPLEQGTNPVGAIRGDGAALPAAAGAPDSPSSGHVANLMA